MDHDPDWQRVVAKLRESGMVHITQFEPGGAAGEGDLTVIGLLGEQLPPPPIMAFHTHTNGVKLLWTGTVEGREAAGSLNILPMLQSALRAPAEETGEPLEGILWNEEFPAHARTLLKRMAIFEHLAGRSAFLTYLADEKDARLFFVDNDDIQPIVPDFATTVDILARYAGADGLREHLTHADWRARIDADQVLQWIGRL